MTTEYFDGSDASGSSGDSSRVITLSNTATTKQNGFFVYLSGLNLTLTDDYTVSHNSSGTTVTFVSPVWDDQKIIVTYGTIVTTTGAPTDNDFESGPLTDLGVTVTRTPVTVYEDNISGQKTYSDGSTEDILVVFQNITKGYFVDKAGETIRADALMFVQDDQTLNKHDKITYEGRDFRVDAVSGRYFQDTLIFKTAILFLINPNA